MLHTPTLLLTVVDGSYSITLETSTLCQQQQGSCLFPGHINVSFLKEELCRGKYDVHLSNSIQLSSTAKMLNMHQTYIGEMQVKGLKVRDKKHKLSLHKIGPRRFHSHRHTQSHTTMAYTQTPDVRDETSP